MSTLPQDALPSDIFVKNTFICCDDDFPEELDMRRSVTDTAQMSTGGPLDPTLYYPQDGQLTIPETNDEDEEDNDDNALPTPIALTRATTTENFESAYEWSWAFDQDARPPVGPPMPQPQPTTMMSNGYVMQP